MEIKKTNREAKKRLRLQEKAKLESIKKEQEEKMKMLLQKTAQTLNLKNYDASLHTNKRCRRKERKEEKNFKE